VKSGWITVYQSDQHGTAALAALIAMSLLVILGAGLVTLSSTESIISAGFRDGTAAQYLAEAGVQHAIVKLKTDAAFVANSNTTTISANNTITSSTLNSGTPTAGTYQVFVTGTGNDRTIIARGTVNKAKRQLVVTLALPANSSGATIQSWSNK